MRCSVEGRQHRISTGQTRRDKAEQVAEAKWLELLEEPGDGDEVPPSQLPASALFLRFLDHLNEMGRADSTMRHYAAFYERFVEHFGDVNLASLTKGDFEGWRSWLSRQVNKTRMVGTLGPKTVSEHLNMIAAIYNHFDLPNRLSKVERPKKKHSERVEAMEFYSADELKVVREAAEPKVANAIDFLIHTGVRSCELRGIKIEDIEHQRQMVWVVGKGSRKRQLTLTGTTEPAWDALMAEIERRQVEEGPVFQQWQHFPYYAVRAILDRHGLKKSSPVHGFRHTFASFALKSGWPITQLAKWLGHSDINTTYSIYGHLPVNAPPEIRFE